MARTERTILGIDPGLANTGWGVVAQSGPRLACVAYGCISTPAQAPLARRLGKIYEQMAAVIKRFEPTCVGIETVWFGANTQSAFATGQARGAALVACAEGDLPVGEFSYMVRQLLALETGPSPDHAADALAAAICYTTHEGFAAVTAAAASGGGAR